MCGVLLLLLREARANFGHANSLCDTLCCLTRESVLLASFFVAGQGNYGYANSVCDMLCMSRRAAGLPALAIAWGPVDHVGYVAEILKVPCLAFFIIPPHTLSNHAPTPGHYMLKLEGLNLPFS